MILQAMPYPASTTPTSSQWRLNFTAKQIAATLCAVAECQMRGSVGGANLATGGTPSASTTGGGLVAANAFDGNASTKWSASSTAVPQQLIYTFGSAVTIEEVVLTAPTTYNDTPISFDVQYDNGSTWVTYWSVDYTGVWASGTSKTFARGYASSPGPFRYWRITTVGNFGGGWNSLQANEIEFRATAGGSKLAGTLTASNTDGSSSAISAAYDGNTGTSWFSNGAVAFPHTITLDMGSGNSGNLTQLAWMPRTADTSHIYVPADFGIEGSNDGSTWTANFARSGLTNTYVNGSFRTFDR